MSKKPKTIQLKNNSTKTYINTKINYKLTKKSLLSDIYSDIKINITMIYNNNTTICLITLDNNEIMSDKHKDQIKIFRGKTTKHQDDLYDKKIGEKIAFNRAIQKLENYFLYLTIDYKNDVNYIKNRIINICDRNYNKIKGE
jgi:hypothetical protein